MIIITIAFILLIVIIIIVTIALAIHELETLHPRSLDPSVSGAPHGRVWEPA